MHIHLAFFSRKSEILQLENWLCRDWNSIFRICWKLTWNFSKITLLRYHANVLLERTYEVFFTFSAVTTLIDVPKAANAMLYLFDSFRYGFFFNLATLEHAVRKCKSILPSSLLFALVRARVNHGKQTSLFHNAAVKKSREAASASDTVLVPNQCLCLKLWPLE